MSFEKMTVAELRQVAELFGVDAAGSKKAKIIEDLDADGVTYDVYSKMAPASFPEPDPDKSGPVEVQNVEGRKVLLRMDRANKSYMTNGVVFSQEHPFQAVTEEQASNILDYETGFRLATPREVEEFYS